MEIALSSPVQDVKSRIDTIERSYQFFLGYAAKGLSTDQGAKAGPELRQVLSEMAAALEGLPDVVREAAGDVGPADAWADMVEVVRSDARAALAAVRLVSSREAISSELIDDLNASIHLRAVLTDLFLVDELLG
jgi:hypothetical protein